MDQDFATAVNGVRALNLTLPTEGTGEEECLYEDEDTLQEIAQNLGAVGERVEVNGVVVVPEEEGECAFDDPRIKDWVEQIHKEYHEFLRETIYPDSPVRGPYGEGRIELKPGAQAKKQRQIRQV